MKEIKAVIRPSRLDEVLRALGRIDGLPGVTFEEVRVVDADRGGLDSQPRVRLEVMVPDSLLEPVLEAIVKNARTGQPGDGRVFVVAVEETITIRTGERETSGSITPA